MAAAPLPSKRNSSLHSQDNNANTNSSEENDYLLLQSDNPPILNQSTTPSNSTASDYLTSQYPNAAVPQTPPLPNEYEVSCLPRIRFPSPPITNSIEVYYVEIDPVDNPNQEMIKAGKNSRESSQTKPGPREIKPKPQIKTKPSIPVAYKVILYNLFYLSLITSANTNKNVVTILY